MRWYIVDVMCFLKESLPVLNIFLRSPDAQMISLVCFSGSLLVCNLIFGGALAGSKYILPSHIFLNDFSVSLADLMGKTYCVICSIIAGF